MRFTFTAWHCAARITCTSRTIGPTVAAGALITLRSHETLFARARTANRAAHTNRADCIAFAWYTRWTNARQYTVRPIIIRNAFVAIDTCRKILCHDGKKQNDSRREKEKKKNKWSCNLIRIFFTTAKVAMNGPRPHRAIQTNAATTIDAVGADAQTTLIHFRIVIAFGCVTITLWKLWESKCKYVWLDANVRTSKCNRLRTKKNPKK